MADIKDIIQNIEQLYHSNNNLSMLKGFERVLDEMNLYVFDNWFDGELASGPFDSRYFVECTFMWPHKKMPDPSGGQKLLEHGCKVEYAQDYIGVVRKIKKPDDMRPGTRKGKIDYYPVWLVKIKMPKKLIHNIEQGSENLPSNQIDRILGQAVTNLEPVEQIQAKEEPNEENI